MRAYQPWPGTFLDTDAGRLIVWLARLVSDAAVERAPHPRLERSGSGVILANAEGALELLEVQPAGGRRIAATDWVRGARTLPTLVELSADGLPGGSALG